MNQDRGIFMSNEVIRKIEAEVGKAILGKEQIIRKVLVAAIAGGHVLLDDIPGVGKTTLALAFSKALNLTFQRVQFTPDVVPSDITGFSVYNRETGAFDYNPGAAMCNILLADEINRTSSKTQSALLEVMQEGSITVDGVTRSVPAPFFVIATQNPIGTAGTQRLPEAQLDRFMVQLSIGYPGKEAEIALLKDRKAQDPLDLVESVADASVLLGLKAEAQALYVDDKIYEYIADLCEKTRHHELIRLGLSPRASLSLCAMAQAWALADGRDYVVPQDIMDVFTDVGRHRLILSPKAQMERKDADGILTEILEGTPLPDVRKV